MCRWFRILMGAAVDRTKRAKGSVSLRLAASLGWPRMGAEDAILATGFDHVDTLANGDVE